MTEETRLTLELVKTRFLRKCKHNSFRLIIHRLFQNELKVLSSYESIQDIQYLLQSEQCIYIAKNFCYYLHDLINNNNQFDNLFDILNCLKLDNNYTLALHLATNKTFIGDVSWFYCYDGDTDIYCDKFNNPNEDNDEAFFQCMGNLSEYKIFKHLNVEETEMGVWQAYLLSISPSLLPTYGHGAYRERKIVLEKEDLKLGVSLFHPRDLSDLEVDLTPWVSIDQNIATVSCCFWND